MAPPRFVADEMVGRLARYLRFVGCDTIYARGWPDDEILRVARDDQRILLTRDRALARRSEHALLLTNVGIADQWKAVRAALPSVPDEIAFVRCTECNGEIVPYVPGAHDPRHEGVPWERVANGLPLYRCRACGHLYWEGSHTAHLRTQLARWTAESSP